MTAIILASGCLDILNENEAQSFEINVENKEFLIEIYSSSEQLTIEAEKEITDTENLNEVTIESFDEICIQTYNILNEPNNFYSYLESNNVENSLIGSVRDELEASYFARNIEAKIVNTDGYNLGECVINEDTNLEEIEIKTQTQEENRNDEDTDGEEDLVEEDIE